MSKFKIGDRVIYHTDVTYIYNVIDTRGNGDEVHIQTHRIRQDGGEVHGKLNDCGWYPAEDFKLDTEIRKGDKVLYRAANSYRFTDPTVYLAQRVQDGQLWFSTQADPKLCEWMKLPLNEWVRADLAEAETSGVKVGDRVQVQVTVQVAEVHNDGYDFTSDESGRFFVSNKDIDGQVRVLKPIPQPLRQGESVKISNRDFTVLNLLDNDWAVVLRTGTNADYKLIHKNDPKVVRKAN